MLNCGPSAGAVPLTRSAVSLTSQVTSPVCEGVHTTLDTPGPGVSNTYVAPAGS